ncbi:MAG: PD-(D/E)XK nuclease-like domain-containing protein [Ruminococcus sp.]|nr:PD-(D/E)XK nuclease-like domain-containing protein [Ruminococcus sp.]
MMINNANYYSLENAKNFMSASQFKAFLECEAKTVAEINGDFTRDSSTAMLIGSYVDAWFEGTLDSFKEIHPEIFLKSGGLKADFVQADTIIRRVSSDEQFMKYMSGEKQKIFTGTIENVPFKGKLDSYHAGKCIVDLKVMRDFEPIWKNGRKLPFIEAWGYDIQGAIYQELVYQETGEKLPFIICAVTKEKVPDLTIISIPQERLDYCLELVKANAPHFQDLKYAEIQPERCEKCDYCKLTKKLAGIIDYRDLNPELFIDKPVQTTIASVTENPNISEKPHKKHKKVKKKHKKIVIKI